MAVEETHADTTPILVLPDEGPVLKAFGDTLQVKLAAEQTRGSLTVGMGITPPGGGPPPHRHLHTDEMFLVLEGRYRFLVEGEWVEAGPGSVVYVPRGAVHTFQNIGETESRAWVLTTPSGFESFFGNCADVFSTVQGGSLDMPRILSICGEHGIEFVPPLQGPPQENSSSQVG